MAVIADASGLLTNGRFSIGASEWLFDKFAGYPYAFDAVMLLWAFAVGMVLSKLVGRLVVAISCRVYASHAKMDDEVRLSIVHLVSNLMWTLPVIAVCWFPCVRGMHEWVLDVLERIGMLLVVFLATRAMICAVDLLGVWYRRRIGNENCPIDGILSTMRWFFIAAGLVLAVALITGKSPYYLLSGLAAAAAVLMLIFQDSILSLAASFQMTSNSLVHIGDWISLEEKGVDGVVESISLHTVKVRNWDETVVALPVRQLVEGSFINNSRLYANGSRRVLFKYMVDMRTVRFISNEEVKTLKQFHLVSDYIAGKETAISQYNQELKKKGHAPRNQRGETNLGIFRAYLANYIRSQPMFRKDMFLSVHLLEPTELGIPMRVCAFVKAKNAKEYFQTISDFTEHLVAIMPMFKLRLFQECSDIYQSVEKEYGVIDGVFKYERMKEPNT